MIPTKKTAIPMRTIANPTKTTAILTKKTANLKKENEEPDAPSLDSGTRQAAEKSFALKGHGFSPCEDATKLSGL